MIRFPKLLKRESTCLLVIDVQERIFGVMQNSENLLINLKKLIRGIKILNIPVYFTEQYPKGLGFTHSEIKEEIGEAEAIQKMSFSCGGAEGLFDEFNKKGFNQIIICGIESHVCVQQTALDLIANDFQVNLPADAVSSRKETDYKMALDRMRFHGIEVTTVESILFELLQVCGTDEFKQVSKIVK